MERTIRTSNDWIERLVEQVGALTQERDELSEAVRVTVSDLAEATARSAGLEEGAGRVPGPVGRPRRGQVQEGRA